MARKPTNLSPLSAAFQNGFAEAINELCNPSNIKRTAQQFQQLETRYGPYEFGKFAKQMLPDPKQWGSRASFELWEQTVEEIPAPFRERITQILGANFRSHTRLPLVLRVGTNVDTSHEMIVKTFASNDTLFIGVLMLCPDESLPPPARKAKT